MNTPFFSVIIPAHDTPFIADCLAALQRSTFADYDTIVVVDGGHPAVTTLAKASGAHVLTQPRRGPAAARNLGATVARGQFLFFLDADCRVHPDTLARAAAILQGDPTLDALFGAYDDAPAAPNFLSQYKNLSHRYIHLTGNRDAATFWSGCGAMRRTRFTELGGFDAQRYRRPSIEDIELGLRLRAAGGRIRLDPSVQVKHLKRWTLVSLLRSDILDRALPWTRLMRATGQVPADLNLRFHHRLSALLVLVWPLTGMVRRTPWSLRLAPPLLLLGLNRDLYRYFYRRRGTIFTATAVLYHWLYYAYSALVFAISWISR